MTSLESYLADLLAVRGAGTAETSGYPALSNHPKGHPLLGERLIEYLRRVLLARARLSTPMDVQFDAHYRTSAP